MKQTRQVTRDLTVIFCDYCGKPRGSHQCLMCKRDICHEHTIIEWDRDYPNRYCPQCWEVSAPFRVAIASVRQKAEKDEDALIAQCRQACLEAK